jgi:D-glycero-alpha-D-manno-heptose 1-phosphate guanylyltransferase
VASSASAIPSAPAAIVLAGGRGTRIRHRLGTLPKPLMTAAGRPFLEWVLRFLRAQGVRDAVLATGYRGERIAEFAADCHVPGLSIRCTREPEPLGTGGALVQAATRVVGSHVLACNGDSLLLAPLAGLYAAVARADLDAAILGVAVDDAAAYGTLEIGREGLLAGFAEKRPGRGLVSAGIYVFRRAALATFPAGTALSLEFEIFPGLLERQARIAVIPAHGAFLDIGTETTLDRADAFVSSHHGWFE